MKKLITFISVLIFFSCGKNKYEKKLYGSWYELSQNEITKLTFTKDSLIIISDRPQEVEWKADSHKIKFTYNTFIPDSLGNQNVNFVIEYKISGDSLISTIKEDSSENKVNWLKANSYLEYILKKNKIDITLPVNDNINYISEHLYTDT